MKIKFLPKIIVASLSLIITSVSVYAEEIGNLTYGSGKNTCAEFLLAAKNTPVGGDGYITRGSDKFYNELSIYMHWAYGYFSAHNFYCKEAQISKKFEDSLDAWLRHYCDKNPSLTFFSAVYAYSNAEGYESLCADGSNYQTVVPKGKGDAIIHPPSSERGIK